MTKSMLLLIGLFFAVPLGVAGAQTGGMNNQGNRDDLPSIDQPGEVAL